MKRFTKLMALGLAAVLTFGMTAQAAGSVTVDETTTTGNTFIENSGLKVDEMKVEGAVIGEVKVGGLANDQITAANKALDSEIVKLAVQEKLGKDNVVVEKVVTGFELEVTVEKGKTATVTVPVDSSKVPDGDNYVVLHYPAGLDNPPEVIKAKVVDGKVVFDITGKGSPFVLVKVGQEQEEVVDPTPTPVPTPTPTPNPNWVYTEVDGVWFMAWQGGAADFTVDQVEVSQGFIFSSETDAAVKEAMGDDFRVTDNVLAAFNFYANNANGTPVDVWSPKFEPDHKYVLIYYVNGLNEDPQVIELDVDNYMTYFNAMSGGAYYYCYIVEVVAEDRPAGVPGNSINEGDVPTAAAPGTSPKTGETLPMAGVMSLILMAGAALCAAKVRYNK